VGLVVGARVLVVDDYAPAATAIASLLRLSGCEVDVAFKAKDVVPKALTFEPDVVLLDISLAGPDDGFDVAEWIRSQPSLRRVRLVAVTGFEHGEQEARIRAAGFDDYLVKPVSFETLERVITSVRRPISEKGRKANGLGEGHP
jgi:DNA-binding response OmpR family regulator